jgi:hypothetical protein
MSSTRGRQVVLPLTNKSGGSVAAGDVVVVDTSNNDAFTTTTTGQAETSLGVALETIANNGTGRVLVAGYAPLINVPSSMTRGYYIQTHTVAKQATGNATRQAGSFGQFLTGGTTPDGWLWGFPDRTATAGTPDLAGLTIERRIQGVSDYVGAYDASATATRGFPVGALARSRQHTVLGSECIYPDGLTSANLAAFDGPFMQELQGTAAAMSAGTGTNAHPGVTQLSTGTSTTGRGGVATGANAVALGGGKVRFLVVAKIDTLSDGTNRYSVNLGMGTTAGSTNQGEGVTFRYSDNVNSGKWQAVCAASSVETATDTGITADTGWHAFEAEVNAAGTSVEFFIDGASVATVTTNIGTGAMRLIPANIVKSAGGTARTVQLDMFNYSLELTTAR